MSDFIFRILFRGRKRIGCFTLIHNVPRCVKLLPCQKITALHTATHALVIRGGSYWTQAFSISRGNVCVGVCEGVGLGVKLFQELLHPSLPVINNPLLIIYDIKQKTATAWIWSSSMALKYNFSWERFLFMWLHYITAYCSGQPSITCWCFNRWRLTIFHKGQTAEQHQLYH